MNTVVNSLDTSITKMLQLYSERLEVLRAEASALHQKVESIADEFQTILAAASMPAEPAVALDPIAELSHADTGAAIEHDPIAGADDVALEPASQVTESLNSDDFTLIAGVDALAVDTLNGFGITSFAELSRLDAEEAAAIGMVLGDAERLAQENWVDQARILASGGVTAYARYRQGHGDQATGTPDQSTAAAEPADPVVASHSDDPELQDIVIEQDMATRQLVSAAAALAQEMADEAGQADAAATVATDNVVVLFDAIPARSEATAETTAEAAAEVSPDTNETPAPSLAGANVVDIDSRRIVVRPRRSRPRAIAMSLVLLLATGVALGASSQHILGFDLTAVASCGSAVMLGDATCVGLPASTF